MNTTILQKAIDELNKENPRLDYVRGMLETMLSLYAVEKVPSVVALKTPLGGPVPVDEAAFLDAKARAAIEGIRAAGGVDVV